MEYFKISGKIAEVHATSYREPIQRRWCNIILGVYE
jgi:hypothetical protein